MCVYVCALVSACACVCACVSETRAIFSNLLQIGSMMLPKKQQFLACDAAATKYFGPVKNLVLETLVLQMKNCERTYQLYLISKIACGEPMTINSVLRCVVMCCLTGGGNNFMKPENQQV